MRIAPETQPMNCPNCGAESDERANFCRQCGQSLSDTRVKRKEDSKVTVAPSSRTERLQQHRNKPGGDAVREQVSSDRTRSSVVTILLKAVYLAMVLAGAALLFVGIISLILYLTVLFLPS